MWWSVRPHLSFGTVEVRICDAQCTAPESEGLASLIVACVAQAARDIDEGVVRPDLPGRVIEENLWRAIRYGTDGELIDFDTFEPYPALDAAHRLLDWTAPVRGELGIDVELPERNGAHRQRALLAEGMSLAEAFAATAQRTRETYAEGVAGTAEVN